MWRYPPLNFDISKSPLYCVHIIAHLCIVQNSSRNSTSQVIALSISTIIYGEAQYICPDKVWWLFGSARHKRLLPVVIIKKDILNFTGAISFKLPTIVEKRIWPSIEHFCLVPHSNLLLFGFLNYNRIYQVTIQAQRAFKLWFGCDYVIMMIAFG